jgi:hypothetical protein
MFAHVSRPWLAWPTVLGSDVVRSILFRLHAAVFAGLLPGLLLAVSPVRAELACAPDRYEADSVTTAAPLAVGATTTRAICQEPTPQPRTETAEDEDYFVFTAAGDRAYTVEAVDLGAALANDEFDRGGLELSLSRLNADGTTKAVPHNRHLNGDRIITSILPAGRYVVLAYTGDVQVYPETNTMDVKTVRGDEGIYGVRLTERAPAPVVTSFRLSSSTVRGGRSVTGTYTLSAPAPPGGMMVDIRSSHLYNAYPGSAYAPAGVTQVSFRITTRRTSTDLRVTLTAWARVGPAQSVALTVRR